jgi:hypothetical protein
MEMRLETITPEKAADWLSKNTNNRPLRQGDVNRLAAAILAGEWAINGESIKFNNDVLIDGQHRLAAVMKAGSPVKTYVVRGVTSTAYDTIDQGRSRSLADILAREGEKHYAALASAGRWLLALEEKISYNTALYRNSNRGFHEYINGKPPLKASVQFISEIYHRFDFHGASVGMFSALHCVFKQRDAELASEFIQSVISGENITRNMPAYKLRSMLLKQATSLKKLPMETICTLTIKAWNATKSKSELKQLKAAGDEARPKIA